MHPDHVITERLPALRGSSMLDREHVHDVLSEFDTLMVATFVANGSAHPETLHIRPLAVAHLAADCTLSFLTGLQTTTATEATRSPEVGQISGQSKSRFITLIGRFATTRDRAKIEAIWKKGFELWFRGPDDPTILLLEFKPEKAEFWDTGGARGLKYLFESAKALVTGQKLQSDEDLHKVVTLS